MHPREQVIRSMARTLIVTSFADWCDEEEQRGREIEGRAGPQQDWMDTTPVMSAACREAALIEAAVLYGRIKGHWHGHEPWILVQRHAEKHGEDAAECYRAWGHNAVMSCLGHGVSWEDDREALSDETGRSYDLHGEQPYVENLDWDWAEEGVDPLRADITTLGLSTRTVSALYNRLSEYLGSGKGWKKVTIYDLLALSRNDLLKTKNIGHLSVLEIERALEPFRARDFLASLSACPVDE